MIPDPHFNTKNKNSVKTDGDVTVPVTTTKVGATSGSRLFLFVFVSPTSEQQIRPLRNSPPRSLTNIHYAIFVTLIKKQTLPWHTQTIQTQHITTN